MTRRLRTLALTAAFATVTLVPLFEAHAAVSSFLKLRSAKQGEIEGSSLTKSHPNWIVVRGFSLSASMPTDAKSGLPTGRRMHKPLVITKELDKSSPALHQAFANNEVFEGFELTVVTPSSKGMDAVSTRVELRNARIVAIELDVSDSGALVERVSFAFQTMTLTDVASKQSAEVSWGPG
jgi:type VI secretion system secreted protein Hcp